MNALNRTSQILGLLIVLIFLASSQCFHQVGGLCTSQKLPKTASKQQGLTHSSTSAPFTVASAQKGFGKSTENAPTNKKKKGKKQKQSAAQEFQQLSENREETPVTPLPELSSDKNLAPGSKQDEILESLLGPKKTGESEAQKAGLVDRDGNPLKERYYVVDFIPIPVQNAIEQSLIFGLGLFLLFFLAGGIGIGLSGFAIATGNPLPPAIESFIVDTLEPAFTPSLVVFFALSSFLGIFKSFQFESRSDVQYKEK
eukprot:CAMPEP_0117755572 /NCGR_PEP_ID=MMETSP0947-20121206/13533_1 /TAXON_ID=44440 /ORGANISM="Chattonella subsalsa, Strain CCMP2191" /LENGTH=255 /DNA_ID=CAMNT_0005574935 /DNA_START=51 /DNA_END=818 /DNA_ORIENTATION=-